MSEGLSKKSCSIPGRAFTAAAPSTDGSVGTTLQPRATMPVRTAASSKMARARSRIPSSTGKKTIANASRDRALSSMPMADASSAKSSRGSWRVTPAPSPDFASANTAPRWVRFATDRTASSTILWLRSPSILAMKPVPQPSCSKAGLYRGGSLFDFRVIRLPIYPTIS